MGRSEGPLRTLVGTWALWLKRPSISSCDLAQNRNYSNNLEMHSPRWASTWWDSMNVPKKTPMNNKVKISSKLLFDINRLMSNCIRHVKRTLSCFAYIHVQNPGMALVFLLRISESTGRGKTFLKAKTVYNQPLDLALFNTCYYLYISSG